MRQNKQDLLKKCSEIGLKINKNTSIKVINEKIKEHLELSESIIKLPDKKNIVKKVYHLADIHIRYLDRHEEYVKIFTKLIEFIKNDPHKDDSILVICGDIFHNKDRFVSETIIIFDNFLKQLSDLLEIFIILGNHDCFNHKDRLDALSGIMQVKNYPKVHLLKESGVYSYSNIRFCVSSILDGKIIKCPEKINGLCYIGLYHGILSGCSLDNEHKINGVSISNFEDYDIVMLGDVHKKQFLNKQNTIAYPGSLIQQNFKEEINHGFLLWDIEKKQSEFICLPNDYAFIDLNLHQNLDSIVFPQHTRLRIIMDMGDFESDLKDFVSDISKRTNILSIKTIFKESIISPKEQIEYDEKSCLESRERDIIRSLVQEEDFSDIINIHEDLHESIENTDMNYKNTLPWSIKEIEFMNIFCYGGDVLNKIKLNSGITGILAANASGKTNILNTILYGLFGNIYTRNHNQNNRNIVSRFSSKKELYVKTTIEMSNGDLFFIERRAKGRTRTSNGDKQTLLTETVDFSNEEKILNLTNKVETEKLIRETLSFSTKDDFILTNMISNISYGTNMSIVSMNSAQLDEIFNNMFNLNKYKLLNNEAKLLFKKLNQEKTGFNAQKTLIENQLFIDIQKEKENLSKTKIMLSEKTKTKTELSDDIKFIYEKISLLNKKTTEIKESKELLISKIEEDNHIINEYIDKIDISKETFYEIECERMSKILKDLDLRDYLKNNKIDIKNPREIHEIEKDMSFYEGKKQEVPFSSDISEEYINAKKMIHAYKNEDKLDLASVKQTIKEMKYDVKLELYTMEPDEREDLLNDLDKTYTNNQDLLKYKKIIEDKEKRDVIIDENIKIQQTLMNLKTELRHTKINYAHFLKETITEYSKYLEVIDILYNIDEYKEKIKILEDNKDYNELIKRKEDISKEILKVEKSILKLNTDISISESNIANYNKNVSFLTEISTNLKIIEKKLFLYKTYINITNSKNLPKQLITNIIKNICLEANSLIYNLCGLVCEIKENDNWEIIIKKGTVTVGPEHCSGYERFIINTSLKIAFDRFKQLPSIKIFLVDEVIDCVSEDNFDQIDILLEKLKKHYINVFLISHNEELKKKVENRIDIRVEDNCSYIC